jgi:carbon monoxide dehydrogenase subunit G
VATDQSVLTRQAVVRVDRDADWVFRELHDPRALMSCVPGGRITRILDARRFEARMVAGVGPFKIAYAGTGHIEDSDPGSRTASLTIAGGGMGMPPSRVRMAMVVSPLGSGSVLNMSFRMTIENTLLSRELVAFIVGDLLCRTVQRMKAQLERRAFHPRTDVGWIGGFHRRLQPCSIADD